MKLIREVQVLERVELNPLSLYRQVNGGRDAGSAIDSNLQAIQETGVLAESYWPRSKGWRAEPPAGWKTEAAKFRGVEAFDVATKDEFGSCLCQGLPVVYGVWWSGGGGHAILAVELLSDGVLFCNSWGDYGDAGFGKMSWSQVLNGINTFGAFALRTTIG